MTDLEKQLFEKNDTLDELYSQRIVELIRLKYTANAECAILRKIQFGELLITDKEADDYETYVNECKAKAHKEVYGK